VRACKNPACAQPAGPGGYCDQHQPQARVVRHTRHTNQARLKSAAWLKFRREFLAEHADCALCSQSAQHVHHLTPYWLVGDQDLDPSAFAALCNSCHSKITAMEIKQHG
jgi:5-methylcytosine-specific restriction enzyme A